MINQKQQRLVTNNDAVRAFINQATAQNQAGMEKNYEI